MYHYRHVLKALFSAFFFVLVQMVLSRDVNVNCVNNETEQLTPLILASKLCYNDIMEVLLRAEGIDVNITDGKGILNIFMLCG